MFEYVRDRRNGNRLFGRVPDADDPEQIVTVKHMKAVSLERYASFFVNAQSNDETDSPSECNLVGKGLKIGQILVSHHKLLDFRTDSKPSTVPSVNIADALQTLAPSPDFGNFHLKVRIIGPEEAEGDRLERRARGFTWACGQVKTLQQCLKDRRFEFDGPWDEGLARECLEDKIENSGSNLK